MLIVHQTQDGERKEYVFRPLELNNLDAEDIEDVGGNTWDDYQTFARAFDYGKTKAIRAALWVCMRATNPSLTFDQVQFKINEIDVFLEADERERIRAHLNEGTLTAAQVEQAKAILAAQPDEPEVSEGSGKDEPAADATGSPSVQLASPADSEN